MSVDNIKQDRGIGWKVIKWLFIILGSLAVLFGGALLFLYCYHPRLIYKPFNHRALSEGKYLALLELDRAPQEVEIISGDRTRLRAYWFEHPEKTRRKNKSTTVGETFSKLPTVLVLHGNEGNLETVLDSIQGWQRHMPVHALVVSYRGYGFSEGEPSMEGIRMDSQAALDYVLEHPDADRNKIIVYGHSLGGAVALHLAAVNSVKLLAVVIENTFLSIPKMAAHAQPALQWFTFVVTNVWNNEEQIAMLTKMAKEQNLHFPHIMFISGERDTVVPPAHMNELWKQIQPWKQLRPEIELRRNHMMSCAHTCYARKGYYTAIGDFVHKITGEAPIDRVL